MQASTTTLEKNLEVLRSGDLDTDIAEQHQVSYSSYFSQRDTKENDDISNITTEENCGNIFSDIK
jgi:hypothetical protein